jgi:hypothetical protein
MPSATYKESLCLSCKHAYANDCFSIPFEQRTWIKKVEIIRKKNAYDARKILKCKKYKEAKERSPLSRDRPGSRKIMK